MQSLNLQDPGKRVGKAADIGGDFIIHPVVLYED